MLRRDGVGVAQLAASPHVSCSGPGSRFPTSRPRVRPVRQTPLARALLPTPPPVVENWAMAYLKPPAIETKIFNKLAMHSTLWDVHTLEVARRNAVDRNGSRWFRWST